MSRVSSFSLGYGPYADSYGMGYTKEQPSERWYRLVLYLRGFAHTALGILKHTVVLAGELTLRERK